MPPRFHKDELSASHAIRRLLDLGITDPRDILMAFELGRTRDNYQSLVKFFAAFKKNIPTSFPWTAPVNINLVRVVRRQWQEGYKPDPRRQRGLEPLPPKKKLKRPKKTSSKSATIRQLLLAGRSTAEICDTLRVTPALVRVVRHRIK